VDSEDADVSKKQVLAIEGWFATDPQPHLLGSRCRSCSSYFFPKETMYCRNPGCASSDFEEVPLSRTGSVWSYTENHYEPPAPYISPQPFVPYTVAAVELADEKMVVLGQIAADVDASELRTGMQVELVVEKLYEDDDSEYLIWKWRPLAA
jgi:uncharacterized OB-fold protein